MKAVYLEPREFLDQAILRRRKDGGVVYSYAELVKAMMLAHDCDEEGAIEWIEYNTMRSLPYMPDPKPTVKGWT
jgi:hypothetical protein